MKFFLLYLVLLFFHLDSNAREYKMNQKHQYEADLVPVSSTVIPLPIYKVSSNLNFPLAEESKMKLKKPVGPLTLITSAKKQANQV